MEKFIIFTEKVAYSYYAESINDALDAYIDEIGHDTHFSLAEQLWDTVHTAIKEGITNVHTRVNLINSLIKKTPYKIVKIISSYTLDYPRLSTEMPPPVEPDPVSYSYKLIYHANYPGANQLSVTDDESKESTATSVKFTVDSNKFSRNSHTFNGWATNSLGQSKIYNANDEITLYSTSPTVNLYATWLTDAIDSSPEPTPNPNPTPSPSPNPTPATKIVSYSVKHYYYEELVKSETYSAEVPVALTTLPIVDTSLRPLTSTANSVYAGWILADKIDYEGLTEIPIGTEVRINYVKLGDINRDEKVDAADLAEFSSWYGVAGEGDYEPIYDLDRDGYVTGDDYVLLQSLMPVVTKAAEYTVKHYYYDNLVKTNSYSVKVPESATTLPIITDSLCSLAGTSAEYSDWILADKISYADQTTIPIGTEVRINYVKLGDVNRDGVVNDDDATAWAAWRGTADEDDYEPIYDLDRDQAIDGADYAILRKLLAAQQSPQPPVVEPDMEAEEQLVASGITTNNEFITITARGTGQLKAYSSNTCLSTVDLEDSNKTIFTIDTKGQPCSLSIKGELIELDLSDNNITNIEFSENNTLQRLCIQNNKLSDLDIIPLKNLRYFHIYGNPIVDDCLTDDSKYLKLKALMAQLPDRSDKALGSIILYPWYGLETLIYKADGNHYKTPEADFTKLPTSTTEKVARGTLCKYPRRLRFVSPANACAYNTTQCEYGTSARAISDEFYTDEPITEVFYNSTDKEDPHRSFKYIRNGIEYENSSASQSILYAIVEGYDSATPNSNSDKSMWSLRYVTYDKTGNEVEHVLTKYNQLRKQLEQNNTLANNWFFGSAIQDTDDYKNCSHYFRESGVQDIWETAQKGFGLTWGIMDCISSCQPDWPHKNIVRYTNFCGNTLNAMIKTDLGAPTITDPRHIQGVVPMYYTSDYGDVIWSSDWTWGHGDHIISYLTSTGQQKLVYDTISCEDYLYGTCPNVAVYVLDYVSSLYSVAKKFTPDAKAMYVDCETFDGIEPTRLNMWYIYRKATGTNTYTTLKTIMSTDAEGEYLKDAGGHYIFEFVETPNVVIRPEDELELYPMPLEATTNHINSEFDAYECVSYKDMFEHCDASSWSWGMSGVPKYMNYLVGRFGERRLVVQSSGNEGDNDPASTDSNTGMRSPSAPYGDYTRLSTAKYHSTAFIVGAATKALGPAEFSNDAADVQKYNFAFSDYMNSFGYGIKGYDNTMGLLSFINGTSMASPNACGIIILMMNLYKAMNPSYSDEPEYTSTQKLSSDLKYDQQHLLSGGYGKFSPFMHYVKSHWMLRPAGSMVHQTGLGLPTFKAEPSQISISEINENIPSTMTLIAGNSTPVRNIRGDQKFTLKCHLTKQSGETTTGPSMHVCSNVALADSTKLIGLRPGSHSIYLCDNNPAYGEIVSHLESENSWVKPAGFDTYYNTYNYYEMDVDVQANPYLTPAENKLALSKTDSTYIYLPDSTTKKFTLQFKIKFNNDSLYDQQSPVVSGGLISYNLLYVGKSYLRYVHRTSVADDNYVTNDILAPGNGANLQYLCHINQSDNNITGYRLKTPRTFTSRTYADYYASTHTTNQSIFIGENSDITKAEAHIITVKSDGSNIYIYLDGTLMITDDSANSIQNLNEVKLIYKLLSPVSDEELFANLDKNVLAYNRCLTEEEIFKNAAYLLAD